LAIYNNKPVDELASALLRFGHELQIVMVSETQTDRQTDTSTEHMGRLKLAAREPVHLVLCGSHHAMVDAAPISSNCFAR